MMINALTILSLLILGGVAQDRLVLACCTIKWSVTVNHNAVHTYTSSQLPYLGPWWLAFNLRMHLPPPPERGI